MRECLTSTSDLRCMTRRRHHTATVVKIALNTLCGQNLAGSADKGVKPSARGCRELTLAISKVAQAL